MDIIIQSLGFTASADLDTFIRTKMEKLDKELKIIRANVTLYKGAQSDPDGNYCEFRLEIPGNDLFVKRHGDSFEKAIADTVHTLQKNIHKTKEKQLDRDHGGLN